MNLRNPVYLGDGVYLADDGYQLWLCANSHDNPVIALEPAVFISLCEQGRKRFFALYAPEAVVEKEKP
jgi:hypothetical protein